jgi:glycosyltransferase involved in cell wall biosynthesis
MTRDATLILSLTPLPPEQRSVYERRFGERTEFSEVASLRRRGLVASIRELRSLRCARVVVAGDAGDLRLFRDLLALMALLVPARERWVEAAGLPPAAIAIGQAPAIFLRIGFGVWLGVWALWANGMRARGGVLLGGSRQQVGPSLHSCLYLKPTLTFGTPVGGSVGHVAGVVNGLSRRGIRVSLMTSSPQPLVDHEVRQVRVDQSFLPAYPHELNFHRYSRIFARAAAASVRENRPDFLYERYTLNDLTGVWLRRRFGLPLVLEFNGSEVWAQKHWGRRLRFEGTALRIERANLREADLVVVVSEEVRKQAVEAGAPEERVLVYPNCIDPSVFDPARFDTESRREVRRRLGIPDEADVFTFVGTFGQWHGTDILASAIRRLLDSGQPRLSSRNLHFLFVGDGELATKTREILGPDLGRPFVTLAGYRPQTEAPAILAASDILLSPHVPNADGSPFFGSPTKLFEYMAMARPIVASDLDQIGHVLRGWRPGEPALNSPRDEAAAILVEPGDVASLVEGIRRAAALAGPERREMGALARRFVLSSYTWERNVRAVIERLSGAEAHGELMR